jgi:hypothetical protein
LGRNGFNGAAYLKGALNLKSSSQNAEERPAQLPVAPAPNSNIAKRVFQFHRIGLTRAFSQIEVKSSDATLSAWSRQLQVRNDRIAYFANRLTAISIIARREDILRLLRGREE